MPSLRSYLFRFAIRRAMRPFNGLSLGERRQAMERSTRRFKMPADVGCMALQICGRDAEWLSPTGAQAETAILYLHGGAYTAGSLQTHRALAARLARASGVAVLLLDYRLAPEHPYPAALHDALGAFRWLRQVRGLRAGRIVIAGDSAGGGLALCTALALREQRQPLPAALACMSPWTDLSLSGASIEALLGRDPYFSDCRRIDESARQYAGSLPLDAQEVSPLFADLAGLPPLHIQVGELEILRSDSVDFVEKARAAGVEATLAVWPGMWHVWQLFDGLPEAKAAVAQLGEFIRTQVD